MPSKLALVTGATSGIGQAICYLLASKGISIIATARNTDQLQKLKNKLSSQVDVRIVSADLAVKDERARLILEIQHNAPDIVINNAGFGLYGDCLTYETAQQMEILQVDAEAVIELSIEAARALVSQKKKGVIVNISSAAAFQVFPSFALYAAAKACVNRFSESFDEELKHQGIRVLALCPGMVKTNFWARAGGISTPEGPIAAMTSEFVAESVWWLMHHPRSPFIIDWKFRWLTYLSYLAPKRLVTAILKHNISKRIK